MPTNRWLPFGLLSLLWLFLVASPCVRAAELTAGVHGMAWGSHAADHAQLTRIRTTGAVSYYVNRDMIYRAADQTVPGVVYGFYQDRFFAVYIRLRSPNQAYYTDKHFTAVYGPAKVSTNGAGRQTIYRWQDDDLKIKLKIDDAGGASKLGIYYKPLATQLNQAQVEDVPPGTFPTAPSDDPSAKSAPLL
jgi:hypothetical protein